MSRTLKFMAIVRKTIEVDDVNEEIIAKHRQNFEDECIGERTFYYFDVEDSEKQEDVL